MRPMHLRWLCLTFCCLAATGCPARVVKMEHKAAAAEVEPLQKTPKKEDKVGKAGKGVKNAPSDKKGEPASWTVEGWGQDEKAAKEHAAKNAREKIVAHLRGLNPPLLWQPDVNFIRMLTWSSPSRLAELDQPVDEVNKLECWSWTVSFSPTTLDLMRREDVRYRAQLAVQDRLPQAEVRMLEMAKLVGWLVLMLLGVWLYVVADQWTEGARRPWLRFGLASLALGGGMGLWLLS